MEIIVCSQNQHKIDEINAILPKGFTLISMNDAGLKDDIPEDGKTFAENALIKARYVYRATGKNCLADDSGLCVEALDGEPGVYSARYAGEQKNSNDNVNLLLKNLHNSSNRKAEFVTVIALLFNGEEHLFEGVCKGHITETPRGTSGFGYDPVFIPEGESITFAEMTPEQKNQHSHRAKALQKMSAFLLQGNL
jgi:XTP/dITP diphosphohydrolase